MSRKLRKRKIKALHKKASGSSSLTSFQCNRNSAAWIEPDGKIHYIPSEPYYNFDKDREELFPMYDHSNYIYKVHLKEKEGDPQNNYMEWLRTEGDKWVKVSNYTNFSINQGFPTAEQFKSFGEIHIECLPRTSSGFMSPEKDIITFVIDRGITKRNVANNMHLLNLEDLPEYQKKIRLEDHPKVETFKIRIKAWEFFNKYCPELEDEYYKKLMNE